MRAPSTITMKENPGCAATRAGVAKEHLSDGQSIAFSDFTQA